MAKDILINLLMDKPIAYHADIAKAVGSVTAGLFLSQLLYWTGKGKDPEGWIYKLQSEWYDETGLTRREQETARKRLKQLKVLQEERRGIPAKLYYKIDFDRLIELLRIYYDNGNENPGTPVKSSLADSANQGCTDAPNKNGGIRQTGLAESDMHTITENTTENTYIKQQQKKQKQVVVDVVDVVDDNIIKIIMQAISTICGKAVAKATVSNLIIASKFDIEVLSGILLTMNESKQSGSLKNPGRFLRAAGQAAAKGEYWTPSNFDPPYSDALNNIVNKLIDENDKTKRYDSVLMG